jgi:hypothetical protein
MAPLMVALLLAVSQPASEVAAILVNPTPGSRAALSEAIRSALGAPALTIADDALTRESTLAIERTVRRDSAGRRVQGRELGLPERFRLVKSSEGCVLVHERSGRRFVLEHTACVAAR